VDPRRFVNGSAEQTITFYRGGRRARREIIKVFVSASSAISAVKAFPYIVRALCAKYAKVMNTFEHTSRAAVLKTTEVI